MPCKYDSNNMPMEGTIWSPTPSREKYKIIRNYFRGGKRTIKRGLYLDEAQAHCRDPETSSRTCISAASKRRTRLKGPWFDSYDDDYK